MSAVRRRPRPVESIAKARLVVISIQSDGAGKVTKSVQCEGNERARQYVDLIANALAAAVQSAMTPAQARGSGGKGGEKS